MRTLMILGALLISLQTSFTQILNPVKWQFASKQVSENEFDLIYTAKIDDGWYVYSQYLDGDDGPIPTSFNYEGTEHYELVGKNVESEENRKEGKDPLFDNMMIVKYSKKAVFTQRVKVSDTSKPVVGWLEFMTCDNERCLPPSEVDFSITLNTNSSAESASTTEEAPEASTSVEESVSLNEPEETQSGILDPVKWSMEVQKVSDEEYDLVYTAKIDNGWYVYSQFLESDDGPVATSFNYESTDHFELVGKNEESSENRKEGKDPLFDNMNIIKYSKEVSFTQRIKTSDPSTPVLGWLEFMTCDNEKCLPPKEVDFNLSLTGEQSANTADSGSTQLATRGEDTPVFEKFKYELAESECGGEEVPEEEGSSMLLIFILGFGGGLIALLTPCVFPMIPLTVSFFTKSSVDKASGIRNAVSYGLSIIVIYVALGVLITAVFGADALNLLSTNAAFNIFFAVLFVVFAISFFGYFEITLPSSWSNRSDAAADQGGLLGIFFMAFTLSLVSFSCTGPIIGTLLVETATAGGADATIFGRIALGPVIGMLGFSVALALPFALFAAFPSWLNSLPKSGGWMNSVKVTLGFVEIALAMKFLSVADLTMGWKILPYEAFLAIWVLCAVGLAAYYMGWIKFPHDSPVTKLSGTRKVLTAAMLALTVYLLTGFQYSDRSETFVTPNMLSGLAPPAGHSYIFPKHCPLNIDCFKDYYEGLAHAKKTNKPILLDFTGHGCVNCRRMEDQVWGQKGVYELINEEYVLVSLYVDDRKKLDEPYTSTFSNRKMRTVGNKWADFQAIHFQRNSQPYYVLLGNDGTILNKPKAYTPDKDEYQAFLECGLERFNSQQERLGLKSE